MDSDNTDSEVQLVMQAEIDRLRAICVQVHDRLLRGDSDRELLEMLAQAWESGPGVAQGGA